MVSIAGLVSQSCTELSDKVSGLLEQEANMTDDGAEDEIGGHPIIPAPHDTPVGTVWPPTDLLADLPSDGPSKYWLLVWIPDHGWRHLCVELTPQPEPEEEVRPQQPPAAKPI